MRTISCLAWVVGIMGLLTAEITVAADGPVADIGPAVDSLAPGVCYRPGAQDRMSLDGKWEFATDPDDQGRAGWFKAGTVLAGARPIEVPGCWEAQGVGDEDSMFRHKYVGRAWYRRRFAVPEAWNGHRVFLTMADVHRRARVWVNGHDLGERVGFLANFEFEVTEFVTAGRRRSWRSRWIHDAGRTIHCSGASTRFMRWGSFGAASGDTFRSRHGGRHGWMIFSFSRSMRRRERGLRVR